MQLGVGAAGVLQAGSQLKKLALNHSRMGCDGAAALATVLAGSVFTNLQELELCECQIGADGMRRLFQVLQGFAAPALEVNPCPKAP